MRYPGEFFHLALTSAFCGEIKEEVAHAQEKFEGLDPRCFPQCFDLPRM